MVSDELTAISSTAYNAMPLASFALDYENTVVIANRHGCNMLGTGPESIGTHPGALKFTAVCELSDEALVTSLRHGVAKGTVTLPMRAQNSNLPPKNKTFIASVLRQGNGAYLTLLTQYVPMPKRNGAALEEQSKIKFAKIRAYSETLEESLQSMTTFTSAASHDLKGPLGNLNQLLQLFSKRYSGSLPEQAREHLNVMTAAATQLEGLTANLLDYARASTGTLQMQPVNLLAAQQDVQAILAPDLDASDINWQITPTNQVVKAEPGLLRTLLLNLVSNSIKYRHPDRETQITSSVEVASEQRIQLSVTDNGKGFDPTQSDNIFQPFIRADKVTEGSGLGLATCAEICRRHDWQISAMGGVGHGATFTVTMPNASARH